MKRGDKLGQFYLISAIIIATALASIFVVSNYIKKGPETNIIDLDEEVKTESRYLIEYGLNQKLTENAFNDTMNEFVNAYASYTEGDNDFYFLFATENKLTVSGYQKEAKTITINEAPVTTSAGIFFGEISTPTQANLTIGGTQLQFTINAQDTGKDFYSIITDSAGLITGEDLEVHSGFVQSDFPPTITTAIANNQAPETTITIDSDTTINLIADAEGKPTPTYLWTLGTQTTSGSTTTMTPEASGTLTLTATNSEGSDSKTWTVVVNAPECNYHEEYAISTACPGATQSQADQWCVDYSNHIDAVSTWSPICNSYNEINCKWCASPTVCVSSEGGGSDYGISNEICPGATQSQADAWCNSNFGNDATATFICNYYAAGGWYETGCTWPPVCVLWGPA